MNSTFEFVSYQFDRTKQHILFKYAIIIAEKRTEFTETIVLSHVPNDEIPEQLLDQLLHSLHIMLGISYWKLYCPTEIVIKTKSITKEQAQFWNTVYTKGLGEFFYKNKIDFRNLVSFPYEESMQAKSISFKRRNRSLVGIGGGKDSIVSAELFKKHNKDFKSLIIDTQKEHVIATDVAKQIGKETITIKRLVDTQLFELNKLSETYNGHIPVSAIYAWIGILIGLLYDYSYIVVSNERSANYGNTEYLGETINHQWSKTAEFEALFQDYIKTYITPDIIYFSLLRSYSEYKITQLFAQYPSYFKEFSSCNTNYAIHKDIPRSKWCGECPKCAFVFIMLAAFIPKEELLSIFGENLLEKESLVKTFKELLGIEGVKPFECVGTPEEVTLAFYKVYEKGAFAESVIMKMFETEVLPNITDTEKLEQIALQNGDNLVPDEFSSISNLMLKQSST